MSARARRLLAAHTMIVLAAMGCVTLLATLRDIPGDTALITILSAAGIGSSGAASAVSSDRPSAVTMARSRMRSDAGSGE